MNVVLNLIEQSINEKTDEHDVLKPSVFDFLNDSTEILRHWHSLILEQRKIGKLKHWSAPIVQLLL